MTYVFWYKITCLVIGLIIIFLGFRLFMRGIFNESGDVEGGWKDLKIIVRKAAPGTYFVIFGSLLIGLTVYKGLSTEETTAPLNSPGFTNAPAPALNTLNEPLIIDTINVKK